MFASIFIFLLLPWLHSAQITAGPCAGNSPFAKFGYKLTTSPPDKPPTTFSCSAGNIINISYGGGATFFYHYHLTQTVRNPQLAIMVESAGGAGLGLGLYGPGGSFPRIEASSLHTVGQSARSWMLFPLSRSSLYPGHYKVAFYTSQSLSLVTAKNYNPGQYMNYTNDKFPAYYEGPLGNFEEDGPAYIGIVGNPGSVPPSMPPTPSAPPSAPPPPAPAMPPPTMPPTMPPSHPRMPIISNSCGSVNPFGQYTFSQTTSPPGKAPTRFTCNPTNTARIGYGPDATFFFHFNLQQTVQQPHIAMLVYGNGGSPPTMGLGLYGPGGSYPLLQHSSLQSVASNFNGTVWLTFKLSKPTLIPGQYKVAFYSLDEIELITAQNYRPGQYVNWTSAEWPSYYAHTNGNPENSGPAYIGIVGQNGGTPGSPSSPSLPPYPPGPPSSCNCRFTVWNRSTNCSSSSGVAGKLKPATCNHYTDASGGVWSVDFAANCGSWNLYKSRGCVNGYVGHFNNNHCHAVPADRVSTLVLCEPM